MKSIEWIALRFYFICRFCNKIIKKEDLEKHQDECVE